MWQNMLKPSYWPTMQPIARHQILMCKYPHTDRNSWALQCYCFCPRFFLHPCPLPPAGEDPNHLKDQSFKVKTHKSTAEKWQKLEQMQVVHEQRFLCSSSQYCAAPSTSAARARETCKPIHALNSNTPQAMLWDVQNTNAGGR